MGTLMGHVLPGSFFLAFALWWCINILKRYSRSRHRRQKFRSSLAFTGCCSGCCGQFEVESVIKIVCCAVGLLGETVTAMDDKWNWAHIGNGQHATMFSVFGFSGVVDLLVRYGGAPIGCDYLFNALCFTVEGVLFMFHLHGRSSTDIAVHTMLVYVVWCCVIALLAEYKYQTSVIAALSRCFFVALQGTWFIQVGFLLYPPVSWLSRYDLGVQHINTMLATIYLAWHMFFIFLSIMIMCIVIDRREAKFAASAGLLGTAAGNRNDNNQEDEEEEEDLLSDLDGEAKLVAAGGANGETP